MDDAIEAAVDGRSKIQKENIKGRIFVVFGFSEITNQDIKFNVFLLFHSIQRFEKFSSYEAKVCTRWAFNMLYEDHWNPKWNLQNCKRMFLNVLRFGRQFAGFFFTVRGFRV